MQMPQRRELFRFVPKTKPKFWKSEGTHALFILSFFRIAAELKLFIAFDFSRVQFVYPFVNDD